MNTKEIAIIKAAHLKIIDHCNNLDARFDKIIDRLNNGKITKAQADKRLDKIECEIHDACVICNTYEEIFRMLKI